MWDREEGTPNTEHRTVRIERVSGFKNVLTVMRITIVLLIKKSREFPCLNLAQILNNIKQ